MQIELVSCCSKFCKAVANEVDDSWESLPTGHVHIHLRVGQDKLHQRLLIQLLFVCNPDAGVTLRTRGFHLYTESAQPEVLVLGIPSTPSLGSAIRRDHSRQQ